MTISMPKPGTGIKHSLLQPYNFEDQAWADPTDPNHLKFKHLAANCVLVRDAYFVRDKFTEQWCSVSKAGILSKLLNERGGTVTLGNSLCVVTKDDIAAFLRHGIVSFPALTYAPGAGDFVVFQHQKRLNIYRDRRAAGDTDHLPATEEFLKVIRNSLCAQPDEVGVAEMLAEISGSTPTLFKWVIHWLSARYQRPGFAPQTNLWFIGPLRGVGKGSLVSVMNAVLGGSAVGKANQLDVQKGWTDSVFGHELIEWDEFKAPGGWFETSNLIKAMTGNETIQINTRMVGGVTHPAVAMHIFSTNDEKPMRVEEHDRQNTFVATTADTAWAARAKVLWDEETREFHDGELVSGFAALLNDIEVDYKFICRPFITEKRSELRDAFGCSVGKWVREADIDAVPGEFFTLERLHSLYREWVRQHLHGRPEDISEFKRKMLNGGWMEPASTTTGSRKMGTRKAVRGFRLCLPEHDEVAEVATPTGANVLDFLRNTASVERSSTGSAIEFVIPPKQAPLYQTDDEFEEFDRVFDDDSSEDCPPDDDEPELPVTGHLTASAMQSRMTQDA